MDMSLDTLFWAIVVVFVLLMIAASLFSGAQPRPYSSRPAPVYRHKGKTYSVVQPSPGPVPRTPVKDKKVAAVAVRLALTLPGHKSSDYEFAAKEALVTARLQGFK